MKKPIRNRPYVPSAEAKRFVLAMSGLSMTHDSIRQVIDPHMSKTTFYKAFRKELNTGNAAFHGLVASKLVKAVEEEKPWALMMCARNLSQFRWDRSGKDGVVLPPPGESEPIIKISFVSPNTEPEPLDITPSAYPSDAKPDYSKPALPAPPERTRTDFGIVEHRSPFGNRGHKDDWMR
jgi:hypothetical protein